MKRFTYFAVASLFAQALGGCSACSKEEDAPVESTPQAAQVEPSATSVSLAGPKMHAPALKGILADKHLDASASASPK